MDQVKHYLFGFDEDLYLCLIYITSETSTHQSSMKQCMEYMKEEIANFSTNGHILLTQDFNACTGSLPDYVTHYSDLHIPLPPDYMVVNTMAENYLTYILLVDYG